MVRKIILDCDSGHDDALAILVAHGDPAVDLLAITTVAGNQTLNKTTLNATRICSIAGMTGIPIVAGDARPLVRDLRAAEDIHRASGLDGGRSRWSVSTSPTKPWPRPMSCPPSRVSIPH